MLHTDYHICVTKNTELQIIVIIHQSPQWQDININVPEYSSNHLTVILHRQTPVLYTGCLQMNGAVLKVNKKFISHLTRAKPTPSAAATVQVSHVLPAVRSLVLTAGLRGQFTGRRRIRKRLSVCSVLRCPDL